jgi:hypothetical protein
MNTKQLALMVGLLICSNQLLSVLPTLSPKEMGIRDMKAILADEKLKFSQKIVDRVVAGLEKLPENTSYRNVALFSAYLLENKYFSFEWREDKIKRITYVLMAGEAVGVHDNRELLQRVLQERKNEKKESGENDANNEGSKS